MKLTVTYTVANNEIQCCTQYVAQCPQWPPLYFSMNNSLKKFRTLVQYDSGVSQLCVFSPFSTYNRAQYSPEYSSTLCKVLPGVLTKYCQVLHEVLSKYCTAQLRKCSPAHPIKPNTQQAESQIPMGMSLKTGWVAGGIIFAIYNVSLLRPGLGTLS